MRPTPLPTKRHSPKQIPSKLPLLRHVQTPTRALQAHAGLESGPRFIVSESESQAAGARSVAVDI